MSKLKIIIDHNTDMVDIVEVDNAFDTFESEERKSSIKAFKNELVKELAQFSRGTDLKILEHSDDFKVPFGNLGFIELSWLSSDPIYGMLIISCDGEFSLQVMQLISQILQRIVEKNSEMYVSE